MTVSQIFLSIFKLYNLVASRKNAVRLLFYAQFLFEFHGSLNFFDFIFLLPSKKVS